VREKESEKELMKQQRLSRGGVKEEENNPQQKELMN
jgi:hypothetical protein